MAVSYQLPSSRKGLKNESETLPRRLQYTNIVEKITGTDPGKKLVYTVLKGPFPMTVGRIFSGNDLCNIGTSRTTEDFSSSRPLRGRSLDVLQVRYKLCSESCWWLACEIGIADVSVVRSPLSNIDAS